MWFDTALDGSLLILHCVEGYVRIFFSVYFAYMYAYRLGLPLSAVCMGDDQSVCVVLGRQILVAWSSLSGSFIHVCYACISALSGQMFVFTNAFMQF
jgi:hypothetical protein